MATFSRGLEQSLHRALALANERHHEYATAGAPAARADRRSGCRGGNAGVQRRFASCAAGWSPTSRSELDNLVTDGAEDSRSRLPASNASFSAQSSTCNRPGTKR